MSASAAAAAPPRASTEETAGRMAAHPEGEKRAAWVAAGRAFAAGHSQASWAFADWLAAGHAAWGAAAMREAAAATGASAAKISRYLAAATAYPPLRRRNGLAFSHHLEVAHLPEAEGLRILAAAEAEGWPHRRTRAAAREAALEGRLARQAAEIHALRRRVLRAAQGDARDAADQARARLGAARRIVRDESRRAAALVEALAAPDALAGLHGNARRGLARDARRMSDGIADDVEAMIARVAAAAAQIEDARAEDTRAGDAPAGDAPAGDARAEDAHAGDARAGAGE